MSNTDRHVGRSLGTKKADKLPVPGQMLFIGAREVELESPIAQSELPMLTGTDLSEQDALDPEATAARDRSDDREANSSSIPAAASQPFKNFVPPTSFYAKPPEKKEKRKPLWVPCLLS